MNSIFLTLFRLITTQATARYKAYVVPTISATWKTFTNTALPTADAWQGKPVSEFVSLISRDRNAWFWSLLTTVITGPLISFGIGVYGNPLLSVKTMIISFILTAIFASFLARALLEIAIFIYSIIVLVTFGAEGAGLLFRELNKFLKATGRTISSPLRRLIILFGVPKEHLTDSTPKAATTASTIQLEEAKKIFSTTLAFAKSMALLPLLLTFGLMAVELVWIILEGIFQFGANNNPELISIVTEPIRFQVIVFLTILVGFGIVIYFGSLAFQTKKVLSTSQLIGRAIASFVGIIILLAILSYGPGHRFVSWTFHSFKTQELKADNEDLQANETASGGYLECSLEPQYCQITTSWQTNPSLQNAIAQIITQCTEVTVTKKQGQIMIENRPIIGTPYITITPVDEGVREKLYNKIGSISVRVPRRYLPKIGTVQTTGGQNQDGWQYLQLDPHGRPRTIHFAQGGRVLLKPANMAARVTLGYDDSLNVPITCTLAGFPMSIWDNPKWQKYRPGLRHPDEPYGSLVVKVRQTRQTFILDSLRVINVGPNTDLAIDINCHYQDGGPVHHAANCGCWQNVQINIGVEYEQISTF